MKLQLTEMELQMHKTILD